MSKPNKNKIKGVLFPENKIPTPNKHINEIINTNCKIFL